MNFHQNNCRLGFNSVKTTLINNNFSMEGWDLDPLFAPSLLPTVTGAQTEARARVEHPCSIPAPLCSQRWCQDSWQQHEEQTQLSSSPGCLGGTRLSSSSHPRNRRNTVTYRPTSGGPGSWSQEATGQAAVSCCPGARLVALGISQAWTFLPHWGLWCSSRDLCAAI